MSKGYDRVAFTQHVRNAQARYGSRAALARLERRGGSPPDELTKLERNFIGPALTAADGNASKRADHPFVREGRHPFMSAEPSRTADIACRTTRSCHSW
jgi:hypothetical protein